MAKVDNINQEPKPVTNEVLNTPAEEVQTSPAVANAPVDGNPPEQPQEDVKVTKVDYRVKSSIGLAPGGKSHRLAEPDQVIKYDEFGETDAERKATIERLLGLDAIEPAKDNDK
jgi:hypothetical protein